jgi:cytochrome P450
MADKQASPFASAAFKSDPYPLYARIRAETPVYVTVLPNGVKVYMITRYEDVQAALKDDRLVKNIDNARPPGLLRKISAGLGFSNSNMLRADPPEHTRLRALAHSAFTPRVVNQMREHIQQIADQLLDAVQPAGRMDLISDFAFPLPITVITEMLGVPTADDAKFRQWSSGLIDSGVLSSESRQLVPELLPMVNYVRNLVDKRRKAPQDDLITKLIQAEYEGSHFTQNEVIATTILLLVAGHETTVNLIGNGMLALLQHPDQFEELKQDPGLIKPAVEEMLRFVNPVQSVNRYAATDVEIGGTKIPKGSHVVLSLAAADHDLAYRSMPEQFNLAQGDTRHVAFGQGIHYCLGAPLARLEGELAFTTLLRRLPNLRLAAPDQALDWRPAFELRGLHSLPVVF